METKITKPIAEANDAELVVGLSTASNNEEAQAVSHFTDAEISVL